MRHDVILLPGVVLPVDLAYGALLDVLGHAVRPVAKELELDVDAAPPPGYMLDLETFADRHHLDPPHRAEPERLAAALRDLWAVG